MRTMRIVTTAAPGRNISAATSPPIATTADRAMRQPSRRRCPTSHSWRRRLRSIALRLRRLHRHHYLLRSRRRGTGPRARTVAATLSTETATMAEPVRSMACASWGAIVLTAACAMWPRHRRPLRHPRHWRCHPAPCAAKPATTLRMAGVTTARRGARTLSAISAPTVPTAALSSGPHRRLICRRHRRRLRVRRASTGATPRARASRCMRPWVRQAPRRGSCRMRSRLPQTSSRLPPRPAPTSLR
mmetsp:Transcript_62986/g.187409  ORF Transcript_62986/g.187409 Transcript_62986/m.187409 type:complete len:245 (-) Transcript_62986:1640-2374(-)